MQSTNELEQLKSKILGDVEVAIITYIDNFACVRDLPTNKTIDKLSYTDLFDALHSAEENLDLITIENLKHFTLSKLRGMIKQEKSDYLDSNNPNTGFYDAFGEPCSFNRFVSSEISRIIDKDND